MNKIPYVNEVFVLGVGEFYWNHREYVSWNNEYTLTDEFLRKGITLNPTDRDYFDLRIGDNMRLQIGEDIDVKGTLEAHEDSYSVAGNFFHFDDMLDSEFARMTGIIKCYPSAGLQKMSFQFDYTCSINERLQDKLDWLETQ